MIVLTNSRTLLRSDWIDASDPVRYSIYAVIYAVWALAVWHSYNKYRAEQAARGRRGQRRRRRRPALGRGRAAHGRERDPGRPAERPARLNRL